MTDAATDRLDGRVALITGGGRGIGRAIAERLAADGARIIVAGRTEGPLRETAEAVGGAYHVVDLTKRDDTDAFLRDLERIDILVNNAGTAESAPYDRTTDEAWDAMMELNATVAFRLCRALIPAMVDAGWGRVITVASNAGRTGYAYTAAYCASKHAVVGMTRALAVELARTPVTINAVCPGWVDTRMAHEAAERIADKTGRSREQAEGDLAKMSPQRRLMGADEVAHLVASLASPLSRGVHGQAIVLDGGQVLT